MLRLKNGYPLRLVVPDIQGVNWVKYLRRIKVGDISYGAKDETLRHIDLMPDGAHRQFSGIHEIKSVITSPSDGQLVPEKRLSLLHWPDLEWALQDLKKSTCLLTVAAFGKLRGLKVRCFQNA